MGDYMITLKNVSTRELLSIHAQNERSLLTEGITSVEDIEDIMKKYPWMNWEKMKLDLKRVKKELEATNQKEVEPEIYHTAGYTSYGLYEQDLLNYGDVLLLGSPTNYMSKYLSLKTKSIAQIKEDLGHTLASGKNVVCNYTSAYRGIGSRSIPHIIKAIEMYEEQIERQAKLAPTSTANLFELNQAEKRKITREVYQDIILYLIENTKERLVWSNLTEPQRRMYIASIYRQKENDTKKHLITYISNYTTLKELEDISDHKMNVLQRFIVR